MLTARTAVRRIAIRFGLCVAAVGLGIVAFPLSAQAHVEIEPGQVDGGGFTVVAFRVPNERDDASTTKLRVILPKDQPLGSVQTTAEPGWTVATATRKLDKPIEMFGAKLDSVVSEVTWTATGGGVRPGQFQDFEVSLGQLPTSGELVFTAIQTYSSGEHVRWNEVSPDGSTEPEHPAPALKIGPPAQDEPTPEGSGASSSAEDTDTNSSAASASDNESLPVLPTALSVVALVVALGAAGLAWRRGRE